MQNRSDDGGWLSGGCADALADGVHVERSPEDKFGPPKMLRAYNHEALMATAAKVPGTERWVVVPTDLAPRSVHRDGKGYREAESEAEARQILREVASQ